MRITKLPDAEDPKQIAKKKALEGCDKCPCCGETRQWMELDKTPDGKYKRDALGNYIAYEGGVYNYGEFHASGFKYLFKNMYVQEYRCNTCGAKWESDPYKI